MLSALGQIPARSPGSCAYLLVLTLTIWLLSSLDSRTTDVLLRSVSTNVVEMSRSAPRVLVLSAFVVSAGNVLVIVVQFLIVHVPCERWLGTRRWLAVIVAGHVGASTITTVGIWLLLRTGQEDRALVYPIDVGVSYTLAAAAAALSYRWQRPLRIVWLIGMASWFRLDRLLTSPTFTDIGHACAFGIGLAVTPLLLADSSGGVRLRTPRTTSPHEWWAYLTSVAPRRRRRRARHGWMLATAAVSLAVGVGFGVLSKVSSTTAGDTASVPAEVVAVERSCAVGCPRIRLAFGYDDVRRDVTVPLVSRAPRVGATRLVQFSPDRPDRVSISRNTENIDAGGFFSLAAVASLLAAVLLVIAAQRRRWSIDPASSPGDTHRDGPGSSDASGEG